MEMLRCKKWLVAVVILLAACKEKKVTSLAGDEPVSTKDFVVFFQPVNLPFYYADSNLRKSVKENDSLRISYKVFTGVVNDTVLSKIYGKKVKPAIYAIGRTSGLNGETFLIIKTNHAGKKAIVLLGFDKDNNFGAALTALLPDEDPATSQVMSIDRRHSVSKITTRKNKDGSISEGKEVYAFNAPSQLFYLVLTEALDEKPAELINPIDTLPRTHKWSADYGAGKMNLVSVRDGRRKNEISFFIHFDRNDGECTGELKGEAIITSATVAEYRKDGDPCKLQFIFTPTSVTLKELEGCGSYRPIKCSFDGSFARKKNPKPALQKPGKKN